MRLGNKSPQELLHPACAPESFLLYCALLRFVYRLWDRGDSWSRWNALTEDSLFILVAAVALRIGRFWSYLAAIAICLVTLVLLYRRWVGLWESVFTYHEHYVLQIVLAVAISTYAIACIAHGKWAKRALP
jgi:hypothetical protein